MNWAQIVIGSWLAFLTANSPEKFDVIFLLDGSASVYSRNFEKVKNWVKSVAERVNMSEPVQLGVVQYSHWYPFLSSSEQPFTKTEISLGEHSTIEDFKNAVDRIKYQGYTTYTAHAINKTVLDFKSSERYSDNTTSKVMILVTDGRASDASELEASAAYARNSQIDIHVVGVGSGVSAKELQIIANGEEGNNERVYFSSDFSKLDEIIEELLENIGILSTDTENQ